MRRTWRWRGWLDGADWGLRREWAVVGAGRWGAIWALLAFPRVSRRQTRQSVEERLQLFQYCRHVVGLYIVVAGRGDEGGRVLRGGGIWGG